MHTQFNYELRMKNIAKEVQFLVVSSVNVASDPRNNQESYEALVTCV
jgi:hypothetical protein